VSYVTKTPFTLTSVLSLIGRGGKEGFCQVV